MYRPSFFVERSFQLGACGSRYLEKEHRLNDCSDITVHLLLRTTLLNKLVQQVSVCASKPTMGCVDLRVYRCNCVEIKKRANICALQYASLKS